MPTKVLIKDNTIFDFRTTFVFRPTTPKRTLAEDRALDHEILHGLGLEHFGTELVLGKDNATSNGDILFMSSFFLGVPADPPLEVFHLHQLYLADPDEHKVNLTIGAYRTEDGSPWVLPVVREAEKILAEDQTLDHEYLHVLGYEPFCRAATELVLGEDNPVIRQGKVTSIQCISGTGSLRAGAEFLLGVLGMDNIYLSDPTWGNHINVFKSAGFSKIFYYSYWDAENTTVDIDRMLDDLRGAPVRSVVLLQACAHNPTGMDPTREEWIRIAEVVKDRNLFTFFDIAYQGFASGDYESDLWAIRYFVEQGLEMLIAQSFAKNFGLYNERAGNLTMVVNDKSVIPGIRSQMMNITMSNWLTPPSHGARIVHMILTTPAMKKRWIESIKIMSSRIREMRSLLRSHLEKLGTPGSWDHITRQIGMFSYTGLNASQVTQLLRFHKIYLPKDGRINVCGLNRNNIERVARAIDEVVRNNNDSA